MQWLDALLQAFGAKPQRVTMRPADGPVRVVRSVPSPPSSRSVRVSRDNRPLWEIRGWRREGKRLVGAYRTRFGSFGGEIHLKDKNGPVFYILDPPQSVLRGSHGSCFRPRPGGKYLVHFGRYHAEIDAGIVAVEKIILAALKRERKTS